jgi:hypothetical protein
MSSRGGDKYDKYRYVFLRINQNTTVTCDYSSTTRSKRTPSSLFANPRVFSFSLSDDISFEGSQGSIGVWG